VWLIARLAAVALVVLALRGKRCAYATFVLLGLLYFPAQVGFRFHPQACELAPTLQLAAVSLQNTPHIIIFAAFYGLSWIQFRCAGWTGFLWAGLATLLMGALLEAAQGVTGHGHCRSRDLVPDSVGASLACLLLLWYSHRVHRSERQLAPPPEPSVAA
jgi:hypothetical protein